MFEKLIDLAGSGNVSSVIELYFDRIFAYSINPV
jgi:hypothetical protein